MRKNGQNGNGAINGADELDEDFRDFLIESLVGTADPEKLARALGYTSAESMLDERAGGSWNRLFFGEDFLGTITDLRQNIELNRLGYSTRKPA